MMKKNILLLITAIAFSLNLSAQRGIKIAYIDTIRKQGSEMEI